MEQTIYSKYSNERAKRFCIRTDIVKDDAGIKKVYKHALTPEGRTHIAQIAAFYERLGEAYQLGSMVFCPCTAEREGEVADYVSFPFLAGEALQDAIKRLANVGDNESIGRIFQEYIRRISEDGGEAPFVVTEAFEAVFGTLSSEEQAVLAEAGKNAKVSADVSDVDMILSNILVDIEETDVTEARWQVIDYEWTFTFPIPKGFLIYRGLYFAYYQILFHTEWGLGRLLSMAGIGKKEAAIYQRMEEQFQKYLAAGALPVRNTQREFGAKIITLEELLDNRRCVGAGSKITALKEKWLHVRKIEYHIDRNEYQDGSYICSGWAFAVTWDGRYLPVNIQVSDRKGKPIDAAIRRRDRKDVAKVLDNKEETNPRWGFDCVWIAPANEMFQVRFSLGRKNAVIMAGIVEKDV